MITLKVRGQTQRTEAFLRNNMKLDVKNLEQYGVRGVNALAEATPMDTGVTAASWDYEIIEDDNSARLIWTNSNIVDGVNIAAILQYGHVTNNDGYVPGIDYINPALKSLFDECIDEVWNDRLKLAVESYSNFLDTFANTVSEKLVNVAYVIQIGQMLPVVNKIPALQNFGSSANFKIMDFTKQVFKQNGRVQTVMSESVKKAEIASNTTRAKDFTQSIINKLAKMNK